MFKHFNNTSLISTTQQFPAFNESQSPHSKPTTSKNKPANPRRRKKTIDLSSKNQKPSSKANRSLNSSLFPDYGAPIYEEAANSFGHNNSNLFTNRAEIDPTFFSNISTQESAQENASVFGNTVTSNGMGQLERKFSQVNLVGRKFSRDDLMYSNSFQKTADKYGAVIGIRYPSEAGQFHLSEGHPTKNFHVKAKSSVTGPTAGFIAADPKYSKVKPNGRMKQQKSIDSALQNGAKKLDLKLTEAQIENAVKLGYMEPVHSDTMVGEGSLFPSDHMIGEAPFGLGFMPRADSFDSGYMTDISGRMTKESSLDQDNMYGNNSRKYSASYHGQEMAFEIGPDNIVRDANGEPVQVLSNPPEKSGDYSIEKPITADYDLFTIIPGGNQNVNTRPLQGGHKLSMDAGRRINRRISEGNLKTPFDEALNAFTEVKNNTGDEDPDKGNIHEFGKAIIKDLNKRVQREGYTGGTLVWHNDETGNPFSPGLDLDGDKPVFFIPKNEPQQITTRDELANFYDELSNADYSPEYSSRFGM